ncbi:hypothetical protein LTR85_008818 [Meristemomyces frigidus]|nr:hypothetical protein LTR85_008818 [Meristemomyces frigidus]
MKSVQRHGVRPHAELQGTHPIKRRRRRVNTWSRPKRRSTRTTIEYEAISYAWGPPIFAHVIKLNSDTHQAITESLYTALQRLRWTDQARVLWADALCINQGDMAEKATQVALMTAVYKGAKRVLVWLGECGSDERVTFAFATLDSCRRCGSAWEHVVHENPYTACACCGTAFDGPPAQTPGPVYREVNYLMRRPWFSRLWVLQELKYAKEAEVICGLHHTTWQAFEVFMDALVHTSSEIRAPGKEYPLPEITRAWYELTHPPGLIAKTPDLLRRFTQISTFSCREAHDRAYAVRSIFNLDEQPGLFPNYDVEISGLFRHLALLCLDKRYNPRKEGRSGTKDNFPLLLTLVGTQEQKASSISRPSWVPDFHHLTESSRKTALLYERDITQQFPWDANSLLYLPIVGESGSLHVRATLFAQIEEVLLDSSVPALPVDGTSFDGTWVPEGLGFKLAPWYLKCRAFLKSKTKLHDLYEDFHLVRNDMARAYTALSGPDFEVFNMLSANGASHVKEDRPLVGRDDASEWLSQIEITDSDNLDPEVLSWSLGPWLSGWSYLEYGTDRILCSTKSDFGSFAGWVPPAAQKGDHVCYVTGAPWPFIVRRRNDGTFQLIGDAFVHGAELSLILGIAPEKWMPLAKRQRELHAEIDELENASLLARRARRSLAGGRPRRRSSSTRYDKSKVLEGLEQQRRTMYSEAASSIGMITLS